MQNISTQVHSNNIVNRIDGSSVLNDQLINGGVFGPEVSVGEYSFSPVITGKDRAEVLKLRSEIYDAECGWAASENNIEQDKFDVFATHFAVKNPANEVVATIRTLDDSFQWMSEGCFDGAFVEGTNQYKGVGINEASRLCVDKAYRSLNIEEKYNVMDLMVAGLLVYNV